MSANTAKNIGRIFGWIILVGCATQMRLAFASFMTLFRGGPNVLEDLWIMFALTIAAAICLTERKTLGFFFLYISTLFSIFGPKPRLIPGLQNILPAGPEMEFYILLVNIGITLFLAWCHWQIIREKEPSERRSEIRVIAGFVILLIPLFAYWKTGIRTGNGEVQKVAETPLVGKHLAPLESTQPILFRSQELLRKQAGTVVFRGMTSESNVKSFAEKHGLKLMTNDVARAKFLPIARSWKLDPDRFPVFTNATDLCYVGRVPKDSKCLFQICHRPTDGRFTALALGNPNEARTAEPPQN